MFPDCSDGKELSAWLCQCLTVEGLLSGDCSRAVFEIGNPYCCVKLRHDELFSQPPPSKDLTSRRSSSGSRFETLRSVVTGRPAAQTKYS